jgi:hypothetical protein
MAQPGLQQVENGDRQQAGLVPTCLKRHQVGASNGRSAGSPNRTARSSAVRKAPSAVTSVVLQAILELFGHSDLNTTMIPHARAESGRARRGVRWISWGSESTPVSPQSCGPPAAFALSSSAYPAGVPWLIPRTSAAGHWLSKQIEPGPLARYTAAAVQLSGYRVEPTARWPDRTGQS